jgi:hypothetical protein
MSVGTSVGASSERRDDEPQRASSARPTGRPTPTLIPTVTGSPRVAHGYGPIGGRPSCGQSDDQDPAVAASTAAGRVGGDRVKRTLSRGQQVIPPTPISGGDERLKAYPVPGAIPGAGVFRERVRAQKPAVRVSELQGDVVIRGSAQREEMRDP